MHSYECVRRDADAMFFSKRKLPLVILADMKHHFCGSNAVFERDVQSLEREKIVPNRLKLSLLHRHILDVSELVMSTGSSGETPAYIGRCYRLHISVK